MKSLFSNLACKTSQNIGGNVRSIVTNCLFLQKFSKVSIILCSLKYDMSHMYVLKLCQGRVYSVVFITHYYSRHGIFPFFNGNPFFSVPFGSFLRLIQIRFNILGGGGRFMQLFSKFMVCQYFFCVIFIGYYQH